MDTLFLELAASETQQLDALLHRAVELSECGPEVDSTGVLMRLDSLRLSSLESKDIDSVGAAFGEALADAADLKWVMAFGDFGLALGLQKPNTSLVCFPLDMIHKRVGRGEEVVLCDLLNATVKSIESMEVGDDKNADFVQCVYGLDSIDIAAERKDGTILLVLVTTGSLIDDPRTIRILDRKLSSYEQFGRETYSDRSILMQLIAEEPPGDMVSSWISSQQTRLNSQSLRLELQVRTKPS